jgi:hypothetical protein
LADQQALGRVEIVTQYAGADGRMISLLLQDGKLDGLVVEGFGLGHVTAGTLEAIKEVRGRGIPVVLSTRVTPAASFHSLSATSKCMAGRSALTAGAHKARVLMLAMTRTACDELQQLDREVRVLITPLCDRPAVNAEPDPVCQRELTRLTPLACGRIQLPHGCTHSSCRHRCASAEHQSNKAVRQPVAASGAMLKVVAALSGLNAVVTRRRNPQPSRV